MRKIFETSDKFIIAKDNYLIVTSFVLGRIDCTLFDQVSHVGPITKTTIKEPVDKNFFSPNIKMFSINPF